MYAGLSHPLRSVRPMSWVGNAEPTEQLGTFSTKKAATGFLRDVQSGHAGGEDEVLQA